MTDIGEPRRYLGMSTLKIHQRQYTENILKQFNMTESFQVTTPTVIDQVDKQMELVDDLRPIDETTGSLSYLRNVNILINVMW